MKNLLNNKLFLLCLILFFIFGTSFFMSYKSYQIMVLAEKNRIKCKPVCGSLNYKVEPTTEPDICLCLYERRIKIEN